MKQIKKKKSRQSRKPEKQKTGRSKNSERRDPLLGCGTDPGAWIALSDFQKYRKKMERKRIGRCIPKDAWLYDN